MRLHISSPLNLLWASRPGDGSDASTIHKTYARELWRERGALGRVGVLVWFLAWPLVNLAQVLWLTAWNGPSVRRRTGSGLARQFAEQAELLVRQAMPPPWYYIFDLYEDPKRARAGAYLHRYETKGGIYRFLRHRQRGGSARELCDKSLFAHVCRERELPHASVVLSAERGRVHWSDDIRTLPACSLFLKPVLGRGGRGCQRWIWDGDDAESRWLSSSGRSLAETELLARVRRHSRFSPVLLQTLLSNHEELTDLAGSALATVRVLSILDEHGGYEPTCAALRIAVAADAIVDNFHAGGIAALVDMVTGELGPARGGGLQGVGLFASVDWCDVHPRTGAGIRGRKLPFWNETVALVREAHAAFPGVALAGWDIAITEQGPILCEGNSAPGLDIFQRLSGEPLGDMRFGALLARHVRSALAKQPPFDASRAEPAALTWRQR